MHGWVYLHPAKRCLRVDTAVANIVDIDSRFPKSNAWARPIERFLHGEQSKSTRARAGSMEYLYLWRF